MINNFYTFLSEYTILHVIDGMLNLIVGSVSFSVSIFISLYRGFKRFFRKRLKKKMSNTLGIWKIGTLFSTVLQRELGTFMFKIIQIH